MDILQTAFSNTFFFNKHYCILIPKGPIDNKSPLGQVMAGTEQTWIIVACLYEK